MIDRDLVFERVKDGVVVITLQEERARKGQNQYGMAQRGWTPVRYVKSGRKGYLKGDVLEMDWKVIGKADADQRWESDLLKQFPGGQVTADAAAALEDLRERDVAAIRKRLVKGEFGAYNLTPNTVTALDNVIHMILAGL